jgi:hypothetical protein
MHGRGIFHPFGNDFIHNLDVKDFIHPFSVFSSTWAIFHP